MNSSFNFICECWELNFISDLRQPNIIPVNEPSISLCLPPPNSSPHVLVECILRFVWLHLGNPEIIPLKKKIHSARSWSTVIHSTLGLLLNVIFMSWFHCFSFIFFFPEYWQSCVCWEFSQNQYGLHEAASICHGFLVQRTAKSSVFGTWGRLSSHGLNCPTWKFLGCLTYERVP